MSAKGISTGPVILLIMGCTLLVATIIFSQFSDVIVDQSLTGVANETAYQVIGIVWSSLSLCSIVMIVIAASLILRNLGFIGGR